jgi:hypothetical protein
LAGGQKEIDNTYGGPERKRHSHEHDNKDRNFPPGYTFHFPPASNRYLRRILILPRFIDSPKNRLPWGDFWIRHGA